MWALVIVSLLVCRAVVPIRRNLRHRFRVAAVVPESDDVVSVYVTGRDLHLLPGAGGPVLHLALPRPLRLVAGEPVLACPTRPTDRGCA